MMPLPSAIVDVFEQLPVGGGYRFVPAPPLFRGHNPRDLTYDGVVEDVLVQGKPVATAGPDTATYCCGVTFEAWFRAGGAYGLDHGVMLDVVRRWFCPSTGHPGMVEVLLSLGRGTLVPWHQAQAGDLIQYWRNTNRAPSGHSAIVLAVEGQRLTYASSQRATDGVGVHQEDIGHDWRMFCVRPCEG